MGLEAQALLGCLGAQPWLFASEVTGRAGVLKGPRALEALHSWCSWL